MTVVFAGLMNKHQHMWNKLDKPEIKGVVFVCGALLAATIYATFNGVEHGFRRSGHLGFLKVASGAAAGQDQVPPAVSTIEQMVWFGSMQGSASSSMQSICHSMF